MFCYFDSNVCAFIVKLWNCLTTSSWFLVLREMVGMLGRLEFEFLVYSLTFSDFIKS